MEATAENTQATRYEGELKVFTWEHEEWVVARDAADAHAAFVETCGPSIDETADDWTPCDPAEQIPWRFDEDAPPRRVTYAELAKQGRGYLGSTNN